MEHTHDQSPACISWRMMWKTTIECSSIRMPPSSGPKNPFTLYLPSLNPKNSHHAPILISSTRCNLFSPFLFPSWYVEESTSSRRGVCCGQERSEECRLEVWAQDITSSTIIGPKLRCHQHQCAQVDVIIPLWQSTFNWSLHHPHLSIELLCLITWCWR